MRTICIRLKCLYIRQTPHLRWDSIHPYVLVNGQLYEMHATPLMTNRWEGFVPAMPSENSISYRYKFDYYYNNFEQSPSPNSA